MKKEFYEYLHSLFMISLKINITIFKQKVIVFFFNLNKKSKFIFSFSNFQYKL